MKSSKRILYDGLTAVVVAVSRGRSHSLFLSHLVVAVSGASAIVVNDAQYQHTTSEALELCVPPPRWSVLSRCGQHLKSAISGAVDDETTMLRVDRVVVVDDGLIFEGRSQFLHSSYN